MEYTVRAAALATGVSEDRLRTWERRYGVPAPPRTDTGRRLYGEEDLAVIRRMAALVESGLSAASAAASVHAEAGAAAERPVPVEIDPRVVALAQATEQLDDLLLLDMLGTAERSLGLEDALDRIAIPALVEAGRRWEHGAFTVAQEHLLSEAIRAWLVFHTLAVPDPAPGAPRILVACPEDERHDLPALGLALLLRRAGARVSYLGGDVPTVALVESVRSVRFDAVCLSITAPASLPIARLACSALAAGRGAPRVYLGGRALLSARGDEADSIPAIRLGGSLREAAALVLSQLHGAAVRADRTI
jgi:DNA-binding transcriptional MerR regulator/methylmalonyl-CoA mutase cobalamin-binding subunit